MTSPETPRPLTSRERLQRQIAANAFWGIDGSSHCNDTESSNRPIDDAPEPGEEYYTMSVDLETGELSFGPVRIQE